MDTQPHFLIHILVVAQLRSVPRVTTFLVCSCVFADAEISRRDRRGLRVPGRLSSSTRLEILHRHRRSPCASWQFYCPEGYCIPASWTCDHIVDCKNGDDERNCVPKTSTLSSSTSTTTETTSSLQPTTTTSHVVSTTSNPSTRILARSINHSSPLVSPTSVTTSTTRSSSSSSSSTTSTTTTTTATTTATTSSTTSSPSSSSSSTTTSPSTSSSTTTTTTTTTSISSSSSSSPSTTKTTSTLPSVQPSPTHTTRTTSTASTSDHVVTSTSSATSNDLSSPPPAGAGCVGRYNCSARATDGNVRSIPVDWLCDGENDCGDIGAEDETNCSSDCSRLPVELTAFCDDGQCISVAVVCNGRADCADRSDELACYCDEARSKVRCGISSSDDVSGQCVDVRAWCNGSADCDDASDEKLCNTVLSCSRGSLRCNSSSECIAAANVCDGVADCADLRDEAHCPCSDYYGYRCKSGVCVRTGTWCDGVVDCPDASDERDEYCRRHACAPNLYQCDNGRCVSKVEVCDGRNSCGDLSDELDCECVPHEFRCRLSGMCVDISRWCDGRHDCPDSSDEPSTCQHECPLHWLRCDDRCLSPLYVCDGHAHCVDASDEAFCNVSNARALWFDTTTEFLTVMFYDSSRFLVCADQWTQHLSNLVCIQAGCNSSINTSFAQPDVDSTDEFLLVQSTTELSLLPGTCHSFRAVKLRCHCNNCGDGGQSTSVSSAWHVGLFGAFGFLCSGVVVDRSWVLTAAHCLISHTPATVSPPWSTAVIQDLRLEIGFHDPPPSDNERATVSYIVVHPSFNSTDRSYDIALVRLSSPLDFGDQVRPVCLPRSSGQAFGAQSQCVVTGLAYTPLSGFSPLNRVADADAKLLTYEQCSNVTSKYAYVTLKNSSMICATHDPGPSDICFGDSGTSLVCRGGNQDLWTIVGLASWSLTNCAVTVYARTTSTMSWIRQTILATH